MAITRINNNSLSAVTAAGIPVLTSDNLPAGSMIQTVKTSRTGKQTITSTSYVDLTGLATSITIAKTGSTLMFTCPLYTETDGGGGHGVCRLLVSTSGSAGTYTTTVGNYSVTGANNNSIGFGFVDYWDHGYSAGTTLYFKVQYRVSNPDQHDTADDGPSGGGSETPTPRTYLMINEIAG